MVGWHHWLNGHELEEAPGIGDRQGSLASMGSQRLRHDWATELTDWPKHCYWWMDLIYGFKYWKKFSVVIVILFFTLFWFWTPGSPCLLMLMGVTGKHEIQKLFYTDNLELLYL